MGSKAKVNDQDHDLPDSEWFPHQRLSLTRELTESVLREVLHRVVQAHSWQLFQD